MKFRLVLIAALALSGMSVAARADDGRGAEFSLRGSPLNHIRGSGEAKFEGRSAEVQGEGINLPSGTVLAVAIDNNPADGYQFSGPVGPTFTLRGGEFETHFSLPPSLVPINRNALVIVYIAANGTDVLCNNNAISFPGSC
jgi:hypothetical protein